MSNVLSTSPVTAAPSRPSCTVDHAAAHIVRAGAPYYPAIAKLDGLTGTATIRVDLSDTGTVQGSYVVKSAGSAILDRAAAQTAKSIAYAPETKSCEPISGSYAVEIEFVDP